MPFSTAKGHIHSLKKYGANQRDSIPAFPLDASWVLLKLWLALFLLVAGTVLLAVSGNFSDGFRITQRLHIDSF